MYGFTTATAEEILQATAVMDPLHVVHLAVDALDRCRRRIQDDLHVHRTLTGDPVYRGRRTLLSGAGLLTSR